jgi:group II intron reverse transcriptase/maturase
MKIILEAYYEPLFRESSHGFRPMRSCHTALHEVQSWKGTTWFIEGDIKGCFDNINHKKLLEVLGNKVRDQQFVGFMGQMLKAGYLENWKYNVTHSGTPQGGVISPLLANILLHELDEWIEDDLIPQHTRGEERADYMPWWSERRMYCYNKKRYRKTNDPKYEARAKERLKRMRNLPARDLQDPNYRRLRYVRYADDVLIGFAGPKTEAEEIKKAVGEKLAELGLTMSVEKTKITHARTERARFLGFELSTSDNNTRMSQRKIGGRSFRYRTGHGHIRLYVPDDVVKKFVHQYSKEGTPHPKISLINTSDFEIVKNYGEIYRGIANYYAPAHNVSSNIGKIQYFMLESCIRTLATKHQCKRAEIYRKYYKETSTGKKGLVVELSNPKNGKTYRAEYGEVPFKAGHWPDSVIDRSDRWHQVYRGTELLKRMAASVCELCGSQERCVVHHIRGLRDLEAKRNKGKPLTRAEEFSIARQRKQVIVCPECHRKIHSGEYDGKAVK